MSWSSWTVDGYGIDVEEIKESTTKERIEKFIALDSKLVDYLNDEIGDELENYEKEDYFELADEVGLGVGIGFSSLMAKVIYDLENIRLTDCDDYEGNEYLLYEPCYPWSAITDEEKDVTELRLDDIFKKYASVLTDKEVYPDYESVENGG